MIGYLDDIDNSIVKDLNNYKLVLINGVLWISNYIKILEYSKDIIKLKVKNNVLIIEGVDMNISMLEKKEIVLKGKFNNIYLEKPFRVVNENV